MSVEDAASDQPWSRFASRLLAARLAAGMTQAELAATCGRSGNNWIAQLERGTNALPAFDDLALLADALGLPAEWFLFGRCFDRGAAKPMAVGLGGPAVVMTGRGPIADLALYPGSFSAEAPELVYATLVLVRMDVTAARAGVSWFLQNNRGRLVVLRGRRDAEGALVDRRGEVLATKSVVGLCWTVRPGSNRVHPVT